MVLLESVSVIIDGEQILSSVTNQFSPGRVSAIIGKSGAGKTTLLQAIIGLVQLSKGKIFVDKTDISDLLPAHRAETVGYVFQQLNLFPHMTVKQNCIDPLLVHGIPEKEAENRVDQLLKLFDLESLQNNYPAQLSGGQQQRIAIIRALSLQPSVLLLDEPTASLDPHNTMILVHWLRTLAKDGLTIIVSSQDSYFTKHIADSLVLIEHGSIVAAYDSLQDAEKDQKMLAFLV